MRVLLVDNFDSFTYNLAQALGGLGTKVLVERSDVAVERLLGLAPDCLVISPGPGTPDRTGSCARLLDLVSDELPVLGVCLGMQLLAWRAGAVVDRAPVPVHGKASAVRHDGRGLFRGLGQDLACGRYHSLRVREESLPEGLEATAWAEDGVLMGVRERARPREGIQFHPESVLTPQGQAMLANFLRGRGMRPSGRGTAR